MSVREKINENPKSAAAIAIVLIVAVLGSVLYSSMRGGAGGAAAVASNRAFYTIDDGATWFADDAEKVPPFDHSGKQAVRARVYRCEGKTFVNHLERYTPEAKKRLEAAYARSAGGQDVVINLEPSGIEVKAPGGEKWVNAADPAAASIVKPKCKGEVELISP